jgi:hypothetical protein
MLLTIPISQFDMHLLLPSFEQSSEVVPHIPHMLQQAFSGHGLSHSKGTLRRGCFVPGFFRPQLCVGSGTGNGFEPSVIHIVSPGFMFSHPFQPQVSRLMTSSC